MAGKKTLHGRLEALEQLCRTVDEAELLEFGELVTDEELRNLVALARAELQARGASSQQVSPRPWRIKSRTDRLKEEVDFWRDVRPIIEHFRAVGWPGTCDPI